MFKGMRRYSEFAEAGEGISTNILADRLARLLREGVIQVSPDPDDSRGKIYRLTDKGLDLAPVLVDLVLWSARHDPDTAADGDFVIRAGTDRDALIREIRATAR